MKSHLQLSSITFVFIAAAVLGACGERANPVERGAQTQGDTKPPPQRIIVAAAADLAFAFEDLGKRFEQQTGHSVTFTFGSTGQLAKQIKEGAPYDVFAAANVSFVDDVIAAGACLAESKAFYARGRIVVWTAEASAKAPRLEDLVAPQFKHVAIANPDHAPYGMAARQALEHLGLWDRVEPKLVYGENVRQTLQFAQSRSVDAAIVALSLAIVTKEGSYQIIDDAHHRPIDQAMAVCKRGASPEVGKLFADFINSPAGRDVMRSYGFVLPGEAVTPSDATTMTGEKVMP